MLKIRFCNKKNKVVQAISSFFFADQKASLDPRVLVPSRATSRQAVFDGRKRTMKPPSRMTLGNAKFVFFHPGVELFFHGASPTVSSPQWSFTTKFGMDWCGSSTPETPEYQPINGKRHKKKIKTSRIVRISIPKGPSPCPAHKKGGGAGLNC